MSEEKQDYTSELIEAQEMIGKGYDQPDALIEPPRTITALSDRGLVDYRTWGWVKTSAKFRRHIKVLKGAKHSIWHYLALGVDENGKCRETIKDICEGTGYSHTEVIDTLRELDEMGYLSVERDTKGNIYKPEFVARGGNYPSENAVKKLDSTLADSVESSPPEEKSPSIPLRVKRVKSGADAPESVEWQIGIGKKVIAIPDNDTAQRRDAANLIATGLGIHAKAAAELAFAFQDERGMTFTTSEIKGQRKAVKFLLEKKVQPEHVREAVRTLMGKNFTCANLFSITDNAVDLANQKPVPPVPTRVIHRATPTEGINMAEAKRRGLIPG